MLFANAVLNGAAVAAVWVTSAGIGAMFGNFAAVVLRRPAEDRSDWIALGGALGCAWGFVAMVLAMAIRTRL